MKKAIALLLTSTTVLALSNTTAFAATQSSGKSVVLHYWIWSQSQQATLQSLANMYHKSHPSVTVEVQVVPSSEYSTKLQAAAQGGTLPDIFALNGDEFQEYAANGMLMPLNNLIKQSKGQVNLANYPQSIVNMYTYDGVHYGIPRNEDTVGLWYNKALFKKAGVAFPNSTWTWKTLSAAAKKLTNAKAGIWGFAARPINQEGYYNVIDQNKGSVVSGKKSGYDNPNTISALNYWYSFIKDKTSPTVAQMTQTDPLEMFESGKIAMIFAGDWNTSTFTSIPYTKKNVDVAVLPKGKVRATTINGSADVIAKNTKYPTQAWDFVQYLGGKQAASVIAKAGIFVPAYKGTQQLYVKATPEFHLQNLTSEVAYGVPMPWTANTDAWQADETQDMTAAFSGSESIATAAKQLTTQMDTILQQQQ